MSWDWDDRPHRRALLRILRNEPSRTRQDQEAEYRVLKWMTLISSASLIVALIIWMIWIGER
jgi:hypothetical protein